MGKIGIGHLLNENLEQLVEWRDQLALEIERKEAALAEARKALDEYNKEIEIIKNVIEDMREKYGASITAPEDQNGP